MPLGGLDDEQYRACLFELKRNGTTEIVELFSSMVDMLQKIQMLVCEELSSSHADLDYFTEVSLSSVWTKHYTRLFHYGPSMFLRRLFISNDSSSEDIDEKLMNLRSSTSRLNILLGSLHEASGYLNPFLFTYVISMS